jgi:Flp pilus assembly protein TadG
MTRIADDRERGQALVEFSLSIVVFLVLMMAIVDLGRGIYMFNGVSQAAREIARVASVHPGTTFGGPEIDEVVNLQKKLIPNLGTPTFSCVAIDGSPGLDPTYGDCRTGQQVTVTISAPYSPATPVMGLLGTWNMQSTSSVRIP